MTRALLSLLLLTACGASSDAGDDTDTAQDSDTVAPTACPDGLPIQAWDDVGPYGTNRHELARDVTLPRADGTTWTLSEAWDGCSSVIFLPDTLPVSDVDDTSIWEKDLLALAKASPKTVTYVFVSRRSGADAKTAIDAMQARATSILDKLPVDDRPYWAEHIVVVDKPTDKIDAWVGDVMTTGIGQIGFAIDRFQRLRGVGSLADVTRQYNAPEGAWPWEANLAYLAHEAEHFDVEAAREVRLAEHEATFVTLWDQVLLDQGFAEIEVTLPSAETLATFDTMEIDVDMRCPNTGAPEVGNCGAWDYLAHLWLKDGESWVELGRFITTYHREARWVLDVTPSLAHLLAGGTRTFKWEWAPPWNTQPTITTVRLRLTNQGKGIKPVSITKLFTGGSFNAAYNDGRTPVEVPIPADAAKVEVWASISGHGAGTSQCAEFCDHQHEFTVGDAAPHLASFPMAGNADGCLAMIADQATPNQWGTWWFGRGGWCPGAPVYPWAWDVTSEVTKGGTATVSYRGLFRGATPPDGAGDIDLDSWLVVYR